MTFCLASMSSGQNDDFPGLETFIDFHGWQRGSLKLKTKSVVCSSTGNVWVKQSQPIRLLIVLFALMSSSGQNICNTLNNIGTLHVKVLLTNLFAPACITGFEALPKSLHRPRSLVLAYNFCRPGMKGYSHERCRPFQSWTYPVANLHRLVLPGFCLFY